MLSFTQPLKGMAEFEEIEKSLEKNQGIVQITGCLESQKAHLIHGLSGKTPMRLVIAGDERHVLPGEGSSLFPGRYSGKSVDPPENVCDKGTSGAEGTDCGYQH